jgi:serine/threonine protein kinase
MTSPGADTPPRILIIEPDRRFCANLRAYTVTGWKSAAVQSVGSSLESVAKDRERLNSFDVVIAACSFAKDGSSSHPALRALRALRADRSSPAVILLAEHGSEYLAAQALKAGAFDYLVKQHASRELIVASIASALRARGCSANTRGAQSTIDLFGYEIRRRLAVNDNVSVHVAFSAERNEDVVLKVLHRSRAPLARDIHFERFVDEFKILFDIDDPAVAEIYDFRVTEQYCYIAMEYFALGHLGTRLTGGPLGVVDALGLCAEIAQALSIIHMAGVVHRDLKPGNIMLREDGSIALIDFGISQSAMLAESRLFDDGPVISGTPYYMSPEQVDGRSTDERTDLYSLGVILFQMLTGRKPYVGESFEEIVAQHGTPEIPSLPAPLAGYQDLLGRLLAPEMDRRLGSARELAEIIEHLLARASASQDDPLRSADAS